MHATNRFYRPLEWCAVGLAGVILWTSNSAVFAQPAPGRNVAYTPSNPGNLPPTPSAALQSTAVAAPHAIVADVLVQGSQLVPTPTIRTYIKTRSGDEYNADKVQEDARTLVSTRQFADVRVDIQPTKDGRVNVVFQLRDRPTTVQKIEYRGAKHLKDDELNNITGLHLDMPLSPAKNKLACRDVIRELNKQGRPFADCYLLKGDKDTDTEVVFVITEGAKVQISDLQFTGNNFVSSGVLATHLQSSKKFIGLFGGDLNKEMVEMDVGKLKAYYEQFGFLDARISYEVQYLPDGRNAIVVFHVIENDRYRVKGAPIIDSPRKDMIDQLLQLSKVKPGEPYDETAQVTKDKREIEDYIGYEGIKANVEAIQVWSGDVPGVVEVHYQIREDKPARVGQIFIIGNDRTRMNVILRQVGLYPGQVLSYPEIRLAEKNLARLGIFKSSPDGGSRPTIEVVNKPKDPDSEYKDIYIHVEEDNTGSLLFGVGVNSDAGLTGSVVVNERNFDILRPPTSWEDVWEGRAWRGAGQEFRMEAVPGTQLQRYSVSWRDPFIFDTQYSLSVSAYYFERQYNEYTEERIGTRVTVGRKLGNLFDWQEAQYWNVTVGARIENVNVNSIEAPPAPFTVTPTDFTSVEGNNFLAALRLGATRDTRDSYMRPTEGSQLDLSYEQITGDHTYPLVNVDFSKFFTVYQRADGSGRHVLALHSQVGWAGSDTPVYDRFYAGGFRSLRGFAFRGVGPEEEGYKIGGDFMLLNSLEYQIPVKANDSIYFVGFVDSGTVETNINHITDYRVSAGVGVRFVVPILGPVPIALDLGFPIVKGPNDNTQVFSFWLGFFR